MSGWASFAAIGCLIGLMPVAATSAQEKAATCSSPEPPSVKVAVESAMTLGRAKTVPSIDAPAPGSAGQITVIARGPILGSMDSEDVSTYLACTHAGFVLTATIVRSAQYRGAVRQNVPWRPVITVVLRPLPGELSFESIWRMKLTNGKTVDRAQTPSHPEQRYPFSVRTTLPGVEQR